MQDTEFESAFSILYENLKVDNIEHLLLKIIDLIRRLVFGISMVIFYKSPYMQVVVNSSISSSICMFMILYKPYKTKLDNMMNFYIEFNTFCILSSFGAFIYEDLPRDLYSVTEVIVIILIYLIIMIPAIVDIGIFIKKFILYIKRRNERQITAIPS